MSEYYDLVHNAGPSLTPNDIAEAEQRGREDNADHGMCYVSGSKVLAARDAVMRAELLEQVAQALEWRASNASYAYPEEITDTYLDAARIVRATP